jgi:hypothetical protein
LVRHADVILFSAAVPFQGGTHHLNEQFPDYWSELFLRFGYQPVDFLRQVFWRNAGVLWWLRQNILVFTTRELATANGRFAELAARNGPLSIVHPDFLVATMHHFQTALQEYRNIMALLASGRTFSVTRNEQGQLVITRTN